MGNISNTNEPGGFMIYFRKYKQLKENIKEESELTKLYKPKARERIKMSVGQTEFMKININKILRKCFLGVLMDFKQMKLL